MNDTRFESCIKCTVCTTVCPVSGVNPRYPDTEALVYLKDKIGKSTPYAHTA